MRFRCLKNKAAMTDQRSFLSAAARKEIITGIDRALAVFDRTGKYLTPSEEGVRARLRDLRRLADGPLHRPPEDAG
jgi:hypothetical protein